MLIVIILGTIGIIYYSWWVSLKDKRYHGIYRFFSFESIFILILLNITYWFKNPLSIFQIISWIFLFSSIIIALYGFYLLKNLDKPENKMENTTRLINSGLYKYIRHPLYLSLILLGFGALLKNIDYITVILTIINIFALICTAKVEEKEMINQFGNEYNEYINKTKMFIPYIF